MSNPNAPAIAAATAATVLDGHAVFESVSLGTVLRYFDGTPQPPERHKRKLRDWKNRNGTGRLVEKIPPTTLGASSFAAHFMLHEGNYGSNGTIVMVVRRAYQVTTNLYFEVIERPVPGMVRVLHRWNGRDELKHLAPDLATAEAWIARDGSRNLITEIVGDGELPVELGKAA